MHPQQLGARFLVAANGGSYLNLAAPAHRAPPSARSNVEVPLKILEFLWQSRVKGTPCTELRSENADAAAVADLVDFVEHVDHVEARGGGLGLWAEPKFLDYPEIDCGIGLIVIAIGETGRQP